MQNKGYLQQLSKEQRNKPVKDIFTEFEILSIDAKGILEIQSNIQEEECKRQNNKTGIPKIYCRQQRTLELKPQIEQLYAIQHIHEQCILGQLGKYSVCKDFSLITLKPFLKDLKNNYPKANSIWQEEFVQTEKRKACLTLFNFI